MKRWFYFGMILGFLLMVSPARWVDAAEPVAKEVKAAQQLVNINAATLEALEALPGIGPVTAQRIIDYRTEHGAFASVDQLVEVKGIGDKSLAKLRPLVSVK